MRDTGKRILKKLGGKGWIAVAVVGLALGIGSSSQVTAEVSPTQTVETTQTQRTQTAVAWRANTIAEVSSEIKAQQVEKNDDVYTIQWGDTLGTISQALETTVNDLSELNNIENPDLIYAGDVLRLSTSVITEPDSGKVMEEGVQDTVAESTDPGMLESSAPAGDPVEAPRLDPVVNANAEPVVENGGDNVVITEDPIVQEPVQLVEPHQTPDVEESAPVASGKPEVPENDQATEGESKDEILEEQPGQNTDRDSQIVPGEADVRVDEKTTVTPIPAPAGEPGENEAAYVVNIVETVQTFSEPFATEYRGDDPQLTTGDRQVVQEGVDGQYQIITTYGELSDGTTTEPISERVAISAPVNQIVEVSASQEVTQTVERTIPLIAGVEYVETTELPVGEERVVQVGQDGYRVEVYEQLVIEGIVQSETLIETTEDVPAQNEIVEVGTAVVSEATTETRVETETIPFETTTQENPDLPVGTENILQEGVDHIVEVTYEDTFENGEVVNTVEVSREVVQPGYNEMIEVGTQEEPVVPGLPGGDAAVLREIDKESEAVKYEKATQGTVNQPNGDGSYTILEPSPHHYVTSDPYNLTAEMIDYYMANVDIDQLNQEFGKLLNEARVAQGKGIVTYMPEYQTGVETRADELASIGNLRINGQPHVRLDGRPFGTAFDYLGENKGAVGENLTGMNYDGNPYELLSEKFLAEHAYTQWLNSPGHKTNQENEMYNGFAVSITPIGDVGWSDGTYDSGYIAALVLVDK